MLLQPSADMIPNPFLCMDRRDFSHGCKKCWTTPRTRACLRRRRKDTTERLSTLYTKISVIDPPNLIPRTLQLPARKPGVGGLFMTRWISKAFLLLRWGPLHDPLHLRVLVRIVVPGTCSLRTLDFRSLFLTPLHAVYPYRGYFLALLSPVPIRTHSSVCNPLPVALPVPVGHFDAFVATFLSLGPRFTTLYLALPRICATTHPYAVHVTSYVHSTETQTRYAPFFEPMMAG